MKPLSRPLRCTNCASVLLIVEAEMARADKQKADGVREKERHETETKQLCQTMKVASSDPGTGEDQGGSLGGLFSTRSSPGKKR